MAAFEIAMKLKLDRIISIATLLASLVAIVLVLKKPAPVAQPQPPAAIAEHAQSFDQKMADFQQATVRRSRSGASTDRRSPMRGTRRRTRPAPRPEVHINSDEISAVLAQSLGNVGAAGLTPDSNIGSGAPTIKDQQVSFDGDVVHGQFLTEIAGKDVWITVSGPPRRQGWLCHVRSHRIQSWRSERSGFAGQSGSAEETSRRARPAETSRRRG